MGEVTSKDIYGILTSNVKNCSILNAYWSKKFPNSEANFKMYFRNDFVNSFLQRKCKDCRLFYGQVNVEVILKRMHLSSGMCCICKLVKETLSIWCIIAMEYGWFGVRLKYCYARFYTIMVYACWMCHFDTLMTSFLLMLLMYCFQ